MVNLIWTDNALEDINNIRKFIAQDSVIEANKFIDLILQKTDKLKQFPQLGRIVPEKNLDYFRELIIKNYRVIYKIRENSIYIMMVVHGTRLLDFNLK